MIFFNHTRRIDASLLTSESSIGIHWSYSGKEFYGLKYKEFLLLRVRELPSSQIFENMQSNSLSCRLMHGRLLTVNDNETHATHAIWLWNCPRVLAQRAIVEDCEAVNINCQRLYAASLARRGRARRQWGWRRERGEGGRDGSRRGWSCVGGYRSTADDSLARRGAARRGVARYNAAWRGTARCTRRGIDGSVGRLACLLTRAPTCGYVRTSPIPVLLSFTARFVAIRGPSRTHHAFVSLSLSLSLFLSVVLLPSHREAASRQEPIWISVDLFLIPLSFHP